MTILNETNDHRFLDEAGDTSFYGKNNSSIIGSEGVSFSFILGMVKFKTELNPIRDKVKLLQKSIEDNPFYQVPSVIKRKSKKGFYFHATDDIPEIRKDFFDFILTVDCSFQAVVARKNTSIFSKKHNNKENEFYADLLSHLLKNKLELNKKLVLNIAERGKSTKNQTLDWALKKSQNRFLTNSKNSDKQISTNIVFNIQNQYTEPLLNIADYFCWSVQRVFEKGETRYYNYLKEKISLVLDLYDSENYADSRNYYTTKNPLTEKNKISP